MPPTFFIVPALFLAAVAAPLVLAIGLFLLWRPQPRRFGRWLLRGGATGAGAFLAALVLSELSLGSRPSAWDLLVAAGSGFTIVGPLWVVWRRDREVQAELRREAAAGAAGRPEAPPPPRRGK